MTTRLFVQLPDSERGQLEEYEQLLGFLERRRAQDNLRSLPEAMEHALQLRHSSGSVLFGGCYMRSWAAAASN